MRKKLIVVISIVCILFTCCSCSSNSNNENASTTTTTSSKKESKINLDMDDRFAIVDATYYLSPVENTVSVKLKIKNKTNEDYDKIYFQFYYYDKNGDKIGGQYTGEEMEADSSTWVGPISTKMEENDFGSIKINYYDILEKTGTSEYTPKEQVEFSPKIEVSVNQMNKTDN